MLKLPKSLPFNVTKREKYAIWLAGGLIAAVLVSQLIVSPLIDKRRQLNRQLAAQSRALQEMQTLKVEYEEIKGRADAEKGKMAGRSQGFTLFSFLDNLAGQVGLKDRIAYMKPSKTAVENSPFSMSVVETKLQGITMKELTAYLYSIETSDNVVKVKGLSISKTGKQADSVDAVLMVETLDAQ